MFTGLVPSSMMLDLANAQIDERRKATSALSPSHHALKRRVREAVSHRPRA